jgi:RimJ/RimL family protein N-acetyltransferase
MASTRGLSEVPTLAGEHVTLEPLREAHAAALFVVLTDPELWRFTDDEPPLSENDLAERYRRLESRRSPDGSQSWLNWAIVCSDGIVGFVQATITGDVAEIAYVVGRGYQSRGYASDAVRAMLAFLETAGDIRTEYATIDERNEPSRRLLDRLGFVPVDAADARNVRLARVPRA